MTAMKSAHEKRDENGLDNAIAKLRDLLGDRAQTGQAMRAQHAHTTTYLTPQSPDVVVFPDNADEVGAIVRIAAEHAVPLIPFGAGTSLEGQVNAPSGGICLDMTRMNRVIEVNAEDMDCTVEPGITRQALNENLRDTGLFFPIDPGANATIGGMTATRASGTNAVRYGTMREVVMAVTAVTANGETIRTAHRARKSSAGYDLTRLFVGSEGTLGIITSVTLRLSGIPQAITAGVCPFPTVEDACNAVIMTIQMGIPVARIELFDDVQMKACNAYSDLDYPETPALFLEFHGTEASVHEQAAMFGEIADECGGGPFLWEADPEKRNKLWKARHDAYWACLALRPGASAVATDVCVPISRLAECVRETRQDIDEAGLLAPIVGHAGDGNFHVLVLMDMDNADEVKRAESFITRLNARALAMDGTCTGEHGIGQGKRRFLTGELGAGVDMMRAIKGVLDPLNIMNPDKIFAMKLILVY